jgi:uncharacterized phage protein gp47/JayE
MPTYPLATLAPTVSSTGISAPTYPEILESLKESFRQIFGNDSYLEADSQDGQLIAVFALAIHDSNQTAVAVYNSFRPDGAVGEGLSSVVKINGIARSVSTNSTADVTIIGQAGTVITSGIVTDTNGNRWDLPATVTVPIGGEITVTATAQQQGDISAAANTITGIFTPTRGWQSVTNAAAATPGAPVETDAALRRRQTRAVSLPAQAVLASIYAGVSEVDGVTAVAIYENDTDATDANGIPEHSIALVVEGGTAAAIAAEIAQRKTPGTGTFGDVSVVVEDENGVPALIRFSRPTLVTITVEIEIEALSGYVSSTGTALVQAIADYISGLEIGADVYHSRLFCPANSAGSTYAINSIQISRDSGPVTASNVAIAFDELAACDVTDIALTVA